MRQKIYVLLAFCILVAFNGRGPTNVQPLAQNTHHLYFDSDSEGRAAWALGIQPRDSLKPVDKVVQHAVIPARSPIIPAPLPACRPFDSIVRFVESHCPNSFFIRGPPLSIFEYHLSVV
jgi:hypothetical protein